MSAQGAPVSGVIVVVVGELHTHVRSRERPGHPTLVAVTEETTVTVTTDGNGHWHADMPAPVVDPAESGPALGGSQYRARARALGATRETLAQAMSPLGTSTSFVLSLKLPDTAPRGYPISISGTLELGPHESRTVRELASIGAGTLSMRAMTQKKVREPDSESRHPTFTWDDDQPAGVVARPLAGTGAVLNGTGQASVTVTASDGGTLHAWRIQIKNPTNKHARIDWWVSYVSTHPIKTRTVPLSELNKKLSDLLHLGPVDDDQEPPIRLLLSGTEAKVAIRKDWNALIGNSVSNNISPATFENSVSVRPVIFLRGGGRRLQLVFELKFDAGSLSAGVGGGWVAHATATNLGARLVLEFGVEGGMIVPSECSGSTDIDIDVSSRLAVVVAGILIPGLGALGVLLGLHEASETITHRVHSLLEIDLPQAVKTNRMRVGKSMTPFFAGPNNPAISIEMDHADQNLVTITYADFHEDGPLPTLPPTMADPNLQKIQHIVVLMMENRSFDHMLGYLSRDAGRTDVDGLAKPNAEGFSGQWSRLGDQIIQPFKLEAANIPNGDPNHSHTETVAQIGVDGGMHGFAESYQRVLAHSPVPGAKAADVMGYYGPNIVWAYDALAANYGICDRWFASHPGPTWPNRYFTISCHLGPSPAGGPDLEMESDPTPVSLHTIFDEMTTRGITWRCFEGDIAFLRKVDRYVLDFERIVSFDDPTKGFAATVHAGLLPAVTFIEPNFTDFPDGSTNDDHPPTSVLAGQELIASIYNTLRTSTSWNETLFLITYDEHGGIYDHQTPPAAPAPPGSVPTLGVRVPAIVISPFTPVATVEHTVFDHTSIARTIFARFSPEHMPDLGARFDAASHLGVLLSSEERSSVLPTLVKPAGVPPTPPSAGEPAGDTMRVAMRALREYVRARRAAPSPGHAPVPRRPM